MKVHKRLAAISFGQQGTAKVGPSTMVAPAPRFTIVSGGCSRRPATDERQLGPADGQQKASGEFDSSVLAGRVALVVDDEPMILEILAEHCTSLNMTVFEAGDGVQALGLVENCPEIEVIVTDVRMPGLDGPSLVERASKIRPDIKVIFVTGYTTYRSSVWPILRKPFDLEQLEAALLRALSGNDSAQE
jgi:CheY-like chemotaxis protein